MEVLLLLLILFGIAYAVTHRTGKKIHPDGWELGSLAGDRGPLPVPGPGVTLGDQRAAAAALTRVEGRQLRRHEAFIVGCLLWVILVVVYGGLVWREYSGGLQNSWRFLYANLPVMALPFCGMVLIATNFGALRSRRDHADELFSTLPVRDTARVTGHIGSVWTALIAQAVFVATVLILNVVINDRFGSIDGACMGDLVVSFVLVVCAAALGVCVARWIPHVVAGPLVLVALAMVGTEIGGIGDRHWSLTRQLSIWPRYPNHDLLFTVRPTWWHAVYLLALGTFVALLAVARHQRDRTVGGLIAASLGVAAVAGYLQTRPMSPADADRIAAMVANPLDHSSCLDHDGLQLCAYQDYGDVTALWEDNLGPVFDAVPAERRADGFLVTWREPSLDRLDPAVQDRLDLRQLEQAITEESDVWSAVAIGSEGGDRRVDRIAVGLWAVDLPLHPGGRRVGTGLPCAAGGQSRGVVALWLAAQGEDEAGRRRLVSGDWTGVDDPHWGPDLDESWLEAYVWDPDVIPPVLWSPEDLAAAEAIVALPNDQVRSVLWSDWNHWVDPEVDTDELLAALDLAPVGPPDRVPMGTSPCT